jgi:serine/threonine protein kinase/tetratricopeptide (TPR) repeat protein
MGYDKHSKEAADTVVGADQIEALTQQLRAACLDALSRGQSPDVEAILHAILRTPDPLPPAGQEPAAITRDGEPCGDEATLTPVSDGGVPTPFVPPPSGAETGDSPATPGGTVDYAPAPADPYSTKDFPGQPQASLPPDESLPTPRGAAPTSFAGYEIHGVLGKGGMGIVYKARQRGLKRIVALKMIRRDDASDSDLARFRLEAEAVAQLQHPNIVQVYEVGEDGGRPFLSLEYVDGGSLKEKLGGEPQPVLHAAQLVELLAWAMSVAHRQGIVHRDLKPANVLLVGRREGSTELRHDTTILVEDLYGTPKISDFGLAKRLEEDGGQTRSGAILGTPNYMAPEQAQGRGKEVGPLADQYALGAILYEMLTGRPPLVGATILETLEQVRTQEPVPPSRLQPKVPRDLETICLKCLQKDPEKRYADCAALADDLRRFVAGEPILARPISKTERFWRWCRRNPRVAALTGSVLALLLIVLAGLIVFNIKLTDLNGQLTVEKTAAEEAQHKAEQKEKEAKSQRLVALDTLGDLVTNVVRAIGQLGGQQDLQKKLLKVAINSLRRVSDNPDAKISLKDSTLAAAHFQLGGLCLQVGESELAAQEYREAVAIYALQVHDDPGDARLRANYAIALIQLGYLALKQEGEAAAARSFFLRASEQLARLEQGGPGFKFKPTEIKSLRAQILTPLGWTTVDTNPKESHGYYTTILRLRQEVVDLLDAEALRASSASLVGLLAAPPGRGSFLAAAAVLGFGTKADGARRELAQAHILVGGAEFRLRHPEQTEEHYREALRLRQQWLASDPDNVDAQRMVGYTHERLGDHYLHLRRPQESGREYEEAIRFYQALVQRESKRDDFKNDLARTLHDAGTAALGRGDQPDAAEKFHAALAIREARVKLHPDMDAQKELMMTLAHCLDHRRAVALAERIRKEKASDPGSLVDVACCFSVCSAAIAPGKPAGKPPADAAALQAQYASQALEALHAAVAHGYRNVVYLETEPDLDAVRDRADFKAILTELNRPPVE